MKLYVANCTKHNQVVCYRIDWTKEGERVINPQLLMAKQQAIPQGRQVALGGDLQHMSQVDDIVDQLARYGAIMVVDVSRMERGKVVPYVMNVDQPVSAKVMQQVIDHNNGVLIVLGKDRRAKAAIAANELVEHAVAEQAAQAGARAPETTDFGVEYEQEEQSEAGEKTIAEGYRVDASAPTPKAPRHGRRKAA